MPKPASTPILAAISTLPVIVACALLGATDARAVTCTVDPEGCDPYVVTIEQVPNASASSGFNVEATSNEGGEFDLSGGALRLSTPGNIATGAGIFTGPFPPPGYLCVFQEVHLVLTIILMSFPYPPDQ
jgi:hypothetical protein